MNNSIDSLIRQIEELKSMEDAAYHLYGTILPDISDPQDRAAVQRVQIEEEKHSKMAARILTILRS
ncbi:MAG: hypothetical protein WC505_01385 [Patescibacteria group bacterium]